MAQPLHRSAPPAPSPRVTLALVPGYTEHERTCPTCDGEFVTRLDCIDCSGNGSQPYRLAVVGGQWWVCEADDCGEYVEGCRIGYLDSRDQLASYEEHGLGGLSDHWPCEWDFDGEVMTAMEHLERSKHEFDTAHVYVEEARNLRLERAELLRGRQ